MQDSFFTGTEHEKEVERVELGQKLAKAQKSLAHLVERKLKERLNHHEQYYVDNRIAALERKIAKLKKAMEQ